jgi:hypothetical protein
MDMGGSAQNTLLTALHHDSQHYNVWLIKGSTLESAMTKAETKLVEDQLGLWSRFFVLCANQSPT